MIRLSGYLVVIAALLTVRLIADWLVLVVFFGFPLACLLDFILRTRIVVPRFINWLVRISGFIAWLPAVVSAFWLWEQMPEPIWRQGPDTSYARETAARIVGTEQSKSLRGVYYFVGPTFTGSGNRYLRFGFSRDTDVLRLLASRGTEAQVGGEKCTGTGPGAPKWWAPSSTTISYRWGSARLCVDQIEHRAFLFWQGH